MDKNPMRNTIWTIGIVLVSIGVVAAMSWVAWAGSMESKTPRPIGPLPPLPADLIKDNHTTAKKVKFGEMLFFDQRLSGDGSTPCVRCHMPNQGWTTFDDLSIGYPGKLHFRSGQTVLNNGYLHRYFWTGRELSLESQAGGAGFGAESNNVSAAMAEARMLQVPEYRKLSMEIFGELPTWDNAARAIAAFERTLNSDPKKVPFDRYMLGDKTAMTPEQIKGMELFKGKANCIACHDGPMFTNEDLHNLGVPRNEAFDNDPLRQNSIRYRTKTFGIYNNYEANEDLGLYQHNHRAKDIMKFRTPPLRELLYTPPYMHNGVFLTLDEVVDFYNEGGGPARNGSVKDPLIKPLNLTDEEKKALVAFLEALSSPEPPFAGIAPRVPPDGIMTEDGNVIPLPQQAGQESK